MIDLQYKGIGQRQYNLAQLIEYKQARIGIIGLGYVGLPLAVEFAKAGFHTTGFDVSHQKIDAINAGQNYIGDVSDQDIEEMVSAGRLDATALWDNATEIDVFYICVPTPMSSHKEPDLSYIEQSAQKISKVLRKGQLVILKSTTYPGTTEDLVQPILERTGLKAGYDFHLAYSPERVDPGNQTFTTANTPIVVGGVTKACTDIACKVMKEVIGIVHPVSSPRVGEMEKLLENTFRSVNIALVNEMAQLCDRMGGVSIWEVVEAAATKPFGFMPFYPGPGLGGHCIPIDPHYLAWLARKYDFETSFITLSAHTNEEMPFYVVDAVVRAIADQPIRLQDAKVLVLGVAFKKDVDDTRHSPAQKVIELLYEKNITNLDYADPFVDQYSVKVSDTKTLVLESVETDENTISQYDVVVMVTDHSSFKLPLIAEHASAIVDTRNAFGHIPLGREKVYLLGGGRF